MLIKKMPNTADLIKKNHYDTKVADIENKITKTTELVKQIVTRKNRVVEKKTPDTSGNQTISSIHKFILKILRSHELKSLDHV